MNRVHIPAQISFLSLFQWRLPFRFICSIELQVSFYFGSFREREWGSRQKHPCEKCSCLVWMRSLEGDRWCRLRTQPVKYGPSQEKGMKQVWSRGKAGGSWPHSVVVCWQTEGGADQGCLSQVASVFPSVWWGQRGLN